VIAGAAPSADLIVADDALVSRVHAELDPRPDGLWVRDLNSMNGTWIDGVRIDRGRVPDGGMIRLGDTQLRVQYQAGRADELWPDERFGPLLGKSARMRALFVILSKVASSDVSVLVHGETGTGKEVVARAIHDASPRASKPFIIVDCGALAENLLDAELFGHSKGAFTGAAAARTGAIEEADGGTVFLDEIGELPLALQPKLLRVLESRTIRRVGEATYRSVDVRFIAATHRGLLDMVATGDFREDLYFRLAVLPIFIPPLRERLEDLELLTRSFLLNDTPLPRELVSAMSRRTWRGNVRELRNFIDRVRTLGIDHALQLMEPTAEASTAPPAPADSSPNILAASPPLPASSSDDPDVLPTPSDAWLARPFKTFREAWIEHGERVYVEKLLERTPQVGAAVKEAGIDRTYLYRLTKKYTR
jgi:two-component system, NtrC family, response regulator GlrR